MVKISDLAEIESVDLREVWNNEASDFTPWLAESISKLGEVLGMDLVVECQEAPVGSFSLDLLARDVVSNRYVIVENQLEATNHDHLGKLLTYAAGYDAGVIVWITREFREEHRQALDWLNQRSDENTEFFGVRMEVWRIDDSRCAPHFTVVAFPNDWQRVSKRRIRNRELSPKLLKYQDFFQELLHTLRKVSFTKARKAQPRRYHIFPIGRDFSYWYAAGFDSDGRRAWVELFINKNKSKFDELIQTKQIIEDKIGRPLNWIRRSDKQETKIVIDRVGNIEAERAQLIDVQNWMHKYLLAFQATFNEYLEGTES